ncbi:MAG TPA: hypothetical protein VH107_06565 [Lacipirellulaceae bacterium]|nr:hypothetical protein [Lacipirellulaceae bacterium]
MTTINVARLRNVARVALTLATAVASQRIALADLPQAGDLVFGLSNATATSTVELVRGTATMGGGAKLTSPWTSTPFIEIVKFDNLDGVLHNAQGNLLGVDFGTGAAGGQIFSSPTHGSDPVAPATLIVDTGFSNPSGLQIGGGLITQTRLGEVAVSPDNTKILASGYDSGKALVYDYAAGDGAGGGTPAASNGRESATMISENVAHTTGVGWLNNSTGLMFSALGKLYTVDSTTAALSMVKDVDPTLGSNGNFTSIAYNPNVSKYIYADYGGFDSVAAATLNKLYVIDPTAGYNVVKTINLSTSINTARDLALDKNGNLFISQFGGTGTLGAAIDFIPAANVLNPATLTDNSSIDWYTSSTLASFSGIDIGFGAAAGLTGDYNGDGKVDARDYVVWRDTGINGAQGYTDWRAHFGATSGSGSSLGSATFVPEPASAMLLVLASCWGLIAGRPHRLPKLAL